MPAPGFEPGSPGSQPSILTTRLYQHHGPFLLYQASQMDAFETTYAAAEEVQSGHDVVKALLETHWPQMFAIDGKIVLGVCMDFKTVTLTTAWVKPTVPRAPVIQQLLGQVQAACEAKNVALHVGFSM